MTMREKVKRWRGDVSQKQMGDASIDGQCVSEQDFVKLEMCKVIIMDGMWVNTRLLVRSLYTRSQNGSCTSNVYRKSVGGAGLTEDCNNFHLYLSVMFVQYKEISTI